MSNPTPGWYPHPHDPAMLRWWDGNAWTEHVQPRPDAAPPAPETVVHAAPAPMMASGSQVRGWDDREESLASVGVGASFGSVTQSAPLSATEVLPDVSAPWGMPDLEPATTDTSTLPNGNGNGNGNGTNGHSSYANGTSTYAPPTQERAPHDPPPWADPAPDVDIKEGSGRLRKILIAAVLAVAVALGGMVAYKQGLLDSVIGGSSRSASNSSVKVFEHARYSFEAPQAWTTVPTKEYGSDYAFATPNNTVVVLDSTTVEPGIDMTSQATRDFIFDTALRGLELQMQGMAVSSSTPYQEGGVVGEQVVLTGMGPDGQAAKVTYTIFLKDRLVALAAMVQNAAVAESDPATQAEYEALLASYRYPTTSS